LFWSDLSMTNMLAECNKKETCYMCGLNSYYCLCSTDTPNMKPCRVQNIFDTRVRYTYCMYFKNLLRVYCVGKQEWGFSISGYVESLLLCVWIWV